MKSVDIILNNELLGDMWSYDAGAFCSSFEDIILYNDGNCQYYVSDDFPNTKDRLEIRVHDEMLKETVRRMAYWLINSD